jgi:Putative beta barrel porin-7 (BBP7)
MVCMRTSIVAVVVFSTFALPSADAQVFSPPSAADVTRPAIFAGFSLADLAGSAQKNCLWGSVDYLAWWTKDAHAPPLVVTGSPADPHPGAIGQPGTRVLIGGSQDYGMNSGVRLRLGGWFAGSPLGWETGGFVLARRSLNSSASSDAAGNPPVYIPFFRPDVAREGSLSVAQPLDPNTGSGVNGRVNVVEQFRLWGAEANLVYKLGLVSGWRVNLLAGFRYLDLQEGVTINANRNDFGFDIQNAIQDAFATRSQFYGGQLGVCAGTNWGKLSIDVIGKVALGATNQAVDIRGSNTVSGTGFGPTATFNEGIFTQASNVGHFTRNDFTVVPQLQLKLSYEIRSWLLATVSYDCLYWSRVVRAAEQIDHNVDLTQSNVFSANGPSAATSPRPLLDRSGFWAQGVSLGLVFRY